MSAYYAPAFFSHLLGKCLKRQNPLLEVSKLGMVVIGTFALVWWPYIHSRVAVLEVWQLQRSKFSSLNHNPWVLVIFCFFQWQTYNLSHLLGTIIRMYRVSIETWTHNLWLMGYSHSTIPRGQRPFGSILSYMLLVLDIRSKFYY